MTNSTPSIKERIFSVQHKSSKTSQDDHKSTTSSATSGASGMAQKPKGQMERRLSLISGIALIVGTMIGSGIFVSPTGLLERTGSIHISLLVWGLCGVISMLGALSYAELGTMIPSSGAEYSYFMVAFGAFPAYTFSFVSTIIIKPSQLAIVCLSFAEYVVEAFTDECAPTPIAVKVVCLTCIAVVTFVNCVSVRLATLVQNVFFFGKLFAIGVIICVGFYTLVNGGADGFLDDSQAKPASIGAIATAFYSGLWAYDGWNNLNYVTEEIINPSRNLPLSVMIGIPLVTVCYLLVNISYLLVMSPAEMMISDAVAVTFGSRTLGMFYWLMPLSVAVSTFGTANGTIFAAGRLCYVASREGHLANALSFVHKDRLTPAPALLLNGVIAAVMIMMGGIESLIDFFSFTVSFFYAMAMAALLVLRRTRPNLARPYKVPIIIPIIVLVVSILLMICPIIDNPKLEYIYSILFIAGGALTYVPFVRYNLEVPFLSKITQFLQMIWKCTPVAAMPDWPEC